jgi:hypothetical protein
VAIYLRQRDHMNSVDGPLVYTPGDNEWTDCHRPGWGDYDPRERLSVLRNLFFAEQTSLGRDPINLERQSDLSPEHAAMAENARWRIDGVLFGTAHVVGSNNGRRGGDAAAIAEYESQTPRTSLGSPHFSTSRGRSDQPRWCWPSRPIRTCSMGWAGASMRPSPRSRRARAFGGPVLVIHGDGHVFTVDTSFQDFSGIQLEKCGGSKCPARSIYVRSGFELTRVRRKFLTLQPSSPMYG